VYRPLSRRISAEFAEKTSLAENPPEKMRLAENPPNRKFAAAAEKNSRLLRRLQYNGLL